MSFSICYTIIMKSSDFVHLHCHSTYSILEGLSGPKEIVARAKKLGQSAVALTDKHHVHGLVEFHQAAEKEGIKPILGVELFVQSTPLVLLAQNNAGYQNLLTLATIAALEKTHSFPTVSLDVLLEHAKGLIALSGPSSSALSQAALVEDTEKIQSLDRTFQDIFGKENFYFELIDLPNTIGQAEINQQFIRWGKKLQVPLVVSCASHYCSAEDAEVHDILLCIKNNARVDDPSRFSMRQENYSMRPFDELEKAFSHVPEALENTRRIADQCSVLFDFKTYHIPRFPDPTGRTEAEYLRDLCLEGFSKKYPKATEEQQERLQHELHIIDDMGFAGYFLIVADFVNEAKRRGITVGPGRGSAAGSIVSYCLGITTLDPLEHGLIFERFLNPERITMPDIDTDFADNRRDEVLDYVREKYGDDRVVQICTFGTRAARAAVKDVGRAYGVPFYEMNILAKLIPARPGTRLEDALNTPELKVAYESSELYRNIIDAALKLEGKVRHISVHACGVIITPEPAVQYTPLQRAPKDEDTVITQYSAKPLEALGLLKMDFLGLSNLTIIQTTLAIIERTRKKKIDMSALPLDDRETFALLQRGETTGVFQFESAGMRRHLKQLKPTKFGDITAMTALYRPGPMEWIPSYIQRKHGREQVKYIHPDLEHIFQETYGIGVYQEQILQLARVFAGYTLGEADLLRRAIGKKIKQELDAQHDKFIEGAVKKKYDKQLAEKIFTEIIMPFAGYGFPNAHAAGYARIAYETGYLKAHYPTEFMAALLSSDAQVTDRIMIEIEECRHMGIDVLPPDINESLKNFTVIAPEEKTIRFGLSAIKGVGVNSVDQIIIERKQNGKFASIEDFVKRLPTKILNKKLLDALAKSGTFDCFGNRKTFVLHQQKIIEYRKLCGDTNAGQQDLFDTLGGENAENPSIEFPTTSSMTSQARLEWEKEILGLSIPSHPLAGLKKYIGKKAHLIANFTKDDVNRKVTLAGILEGIKKIRTKKNETMAIITLGDPTGKMEVTLFPRVYAEAEKLLVEPDTVLVICGTLNLRAAQLQLRADAIKRSSLSTMIEKAKAEGFFDEEEAKRGISPVRHTFDEEESIEMIDDEGNVIAGENITLNAHSDANADGFLGPLGIWLMEGMPTDDLLEKLHSSLSSKDTQANHQILLPSRAPKQLLFDLKNALTQFPGTESVALKIGQQNLLLPLTVKWSPILEKNIEELLGEYAVFS